MQRAATTDGLTRLGSILERMGLSVREPAEILTAPAEPQPAKRPTLSDSTKLALMGESISRHSASHRTLTMPSRRLGAGHIAALALVLFVIVEAVRTGLWMWETYH